MGLNTPHPATVLMETTVRKEISFDVNQQFSKTGCPHFLFVVLFFCSLFVTFISSSFDYGTLVPKYGIIFQLASILWSNHPLVIVFLAAEHRPCSPTIHRSIVHVTSEIYTYILHHN